MSSARASVTPSDPVSNLDPAEIAKFERMAEQWWDPEGEFKPLHQMNPVRANYIDLRARVAGRRLLDVGCGGGLLSEAMAHRGALVTGIDMGAAPLSVAKSHAETQDLSIDYQRITVEDLAAQQPQTFDIVTCLEMLEHVPDPASVIAACAQLLKPGGHAFFSTINRTPLAYATAIIGAEYLLRWLPKGTHDYRHFIRPSELCGWARQSGLLIEDLSGLEYSPLSRSFRVGTRVQINYIAHLRKAEVASCL